MISDLSDQDSLLEYALPFYSLNTIHIKNLVEFQSARKVSYRYRNAKYVQRSKIMSFCFSFKDLLLKV